MSGTAGAGPAAIRPDPAHPRRAFRWTAYLLGVTAFAAAVPTPLYPVYEARFGFAAGILGLVFAAYSAGVLVTLFLVAPLAERVGRRKLLGAGMLLVVAGSIVFALASDVVWLAIGRVVYGLAVGMTTSVATAAMTDVEPYRDQHHVARVTVAANFGAVALGIMLSGLVLQFVADAIRWVFVLPLVAAALGYAVVGSLPETATALGDRSPYRVQRIAVPSALRSPFWVAAGGLAACYSIYGLYAALMPSYVHGGLAIHSPALAAALVGSLFGAAALVQLATAQLRDRRALLAGMPLLLASLLAFLATLDSSSAALAAAVSVTLGIAVGLSYMGAVTLVDRVAPSDRRGEMLAAFYSTGYLALAVPTIGVAEASESIGLGPAGMLFAGILAVTVAGLYLATTRTPTPPGGGGRLRPAPLGPV